MLKHVPDILSPELMLMLMEMGHGDEIVIADGNFPGAGLAQRLVRLNGLGVPSVLAAVAHFMPLDQYADDNACVMSPEGGDKGKPPIWKDFASILEKSEGGKVTLTEIDREDFYDRAEGAFGIVMTSETALYGNIILKKGVVK